MIPVYMCNRIRSGRTSRWSLRLLNIVKLLPPLVVLLLATTASAATPAYEIEVIKSTRELRLKQGDEIIQTFPVAFGKGETGPKRRRGDNRTPVGTYQIQDFISDSKFHFFMQLNYPNTLDAWHGYQDQLISGADFRVIVLAIRQNRMPPQDTALGGQIGIHGLGETTAESLKIHNNVNWTEGCIALTNEEINILKRYAVRGTRVRIID